MATETKTEETKKPKKTEKKKAEKKPEEKKKKGGFLGIRRLGGWLLKKMAKGGANELSTNAEEVNKLNVFPVPDGDTGDNMKMTIDSGIAAIENVDSNNIAVVMEAFSHGMLLGARGNSGVILSQFFAGMAKGLNDAKKADAVTLGAALEMGVQQAYSSVMTPTEGTILTVAREAVEYAVKRIDEKSTIRTLFADLVNEMHASLDRTPEILTVLKEANVVDSGAAGLFYIMDGFNRVLNGEDVPNSELPESAKKTSTPPTSYSFGPDSVMTYGYCTELLLQLQNSKTDIDAFNIEALRAFLVSMGDSVVCFKTDSIVKLHVHTFEPEKVLAHCRAFGEFLTVKIENMSVQHTELAKEDKAEAPAAAAEEATASPEAENTADEEKVDFTEPPKKYGIVAVGIGDGIENLFKEFGVDQVVRGGQTNNPSTNEFLEAFSKINAENIFVFPNNGNIFLAAKQASELYTAASVHVIPTKSLGTGYVLLTALDFENSDIETILADADALMANVTVGYVSPSIRDADMNGIHINKGDTIGIVDKEILVSEAERTEAEKKLVSILLEREDKSMLTIFCGIDATDEEKATIESYIAEKHPGAEAYFIEGGQEIYPFIFVAE